ncbi:MAG: hypothetical protein L6Q92_06780 [Phycisphaerae bacterium]|nr:hypothetical protein [Phycisphaerae bacterium]
MSDVEPGQRVRIRQTIHVRNGDWSHEVEGVVVSVERRPTGSWFAHGKRDKLWLRRVQLRKDDGELVLVNLTPDTDVTPAGS